MGAHLRQYFIDDPDSRRAAAEAIRSGAVVAHAFGNFYALTARPERAVVEHVNRLKGRPLDQVGSVLTTRNHIDGLFDWDCLPSGIDRRRMRGLIDALFERGPIGFRGPASATMPSHLTSMDGTIRTTQLVGPGYRCPSNTMIDQAIDRIGTSFLSVTSANRSRHVTGAEDEPAHFEAAGLEAEFGAEPDVVIVRHRDEAVARARHPHYLPMSTTLIAFHRPGAERPGARPALIVERHGSLGLVDLARIAATHGFDLAMGPKAARRLSQRAPIAVFDRACARR